MKLNWSPKLSVGLTEITPDTSVSDSGVIHSIQQFCFSSNHNDAYGLFLERNINKKPFKASVRQHLEKRKRKKKLFQRFWKKRRGNKFNTICSSDRTRFFWKQSVKAVLKTQQVSSPISSTFSLVFKQADWCSKTNWWTYRSFISWWRMHFISMMGESQ